MKANSDGFFPKTGRLLLKLRVILLFLAFAGAGDAQIRWAPLSLRLSARQGDEAVTGHFVGENNSGNALLITRCEPSCDCVSIECPVTVVYPNQKVEVSVTYRLRGRTGVQKQQIFVVSESLNENRTTVSQTLDLIVSIAPLATVSPALMYWTIDGTDTQNSFDVEVLAPNKLESINVDASTNFKIEILDVIPKRKARIVLKLDNSGFHGTDSFEVKIRLDENAVVRKTVYCLVR